MTDNINQSVIKEVLTLSQDSDEALKEAVQKLVTIYNKNCELSEEHARLAAMGEIMDSVAHQWKQPLNALSMMMEIMKIDFKNGDVDNKYIENLETDVYRQISHMTNTLTEFRNFLRPSNKLKTFYIHELFASVLLLMRDELISQNIHLQVEIDNETSFHGNENELKHLFLNIINNAIDVFNERDISNREIYFRCYTKNTFVVIELEDNAGGIPQDVIGKIFEANFTTKERGKGTGIGLYMSSKIVHKYSGTIEVTNTKEGALFTINLPRNETNPLA